MAGFGFARSWAIAAVNVRRAKIYGPHTSILVTPHTRKPPRCLAEKYLQVAGFHKTSRLRPFTMMMTMMIMMRSPARTCSSLGVVLLSLSLYRTFPLPLSLHLSLNFCAHQVRFVKQPLVRSDLDLFYASCGQIFPAISSLSLPPSSISLSFSLSPTLLGAAPPRALA